jgi:hypothetical protein
MLECNGELVSVSVVFLIDRHFFQGHYLMWDVWCVWWGCLFGAECFFDVLDNDGEAL